MSFIQLSFIFLNIILSCNAGLVVKLRRSGGEVNKKFDGALKSSITSHTDEIEPFLPSDKSISFAKRMAFIEWRGEATIKNIIIDGLSNVERSSDVIITSDRKTGILEMSVTLRYPRIFYQADVLVNYMGWGPKRHVFGHVDKVFIDVKFLYDPKIEVVSLETFHLRPWNDLNFKLDSDGIILNTLRNFILGRLIGTFKGVVRFGVEKSVGSILSRSLTDSLIIKDIMSSLIFKR